MTRAGARCASYCIEGSDFCYWHAPEKAEDRKQARSRGGHARHGRSLATAGGIDVALSSVGDVCKLLEATARDLLSLENSVSRARAIAYVSSVAIRALEIAELEQRLTRLEEMVGVADGK